VREIARRIGAVRAVGFIPNNSEKQPEVVMKKLVNVTAVCVAVMLLVLPLASYGQDKTTPPSQAQAGEKTFQGQLTKVDTNAKRITVKGTDSDMTFDYNDATQVTGTEKNIQGLAGKSGTDLKVTYRDAGGKHMATRIETVENK
jgi:NADH dehydrogenase FAD-containing subunit